MKLDRFEEVGCASVARRRNGELLVFVFCVGEELYIPCSFLEVLHGRTKPVLRVKPAQAEIRGALRSPESANHSKSVFDTIIFGSFFNYSVPRRESGVVNQSNKQ